MPTAANKTAALSENIANIKHAKAVGHVAVRKKLRNLVIVGVPVHTDWC